MTGTVYGTSFNLTTTAAFNSNYDGMTGTVSGNFNSSGWSGETVITGRDGNMQCTFTMPFSGSKLSTLEVQSPHSTLTRTTENRQNSNSFPKGTIRIFEEAFGVSSETDSQSER